MTAAPNTTGSSRRDTLVAAAVWLASVAFYLGFDPFGRPVGLDAATWDWMSISLPDGRLPYRDIFLHKTPLAAVIGAAGAALAGAVGAAPLDGAHATCIVFGAAAPALLYLLCRARAGVLASLAAAVFMLAIDQWAVAPVEGVRPKVYTTALGIGCLLAAERGRWLSAGIAGGAATMCWQPGLAFLVGALWALRREGAGRPALARLALGAALVPTATLLWLASVGALGEFYAQAVLFNFKYIRLHSRSIGTTLERLARLGSSWNAVELALLGPALLGAALRPRTVPAGLMAAGAAYLALAFVSFQAWPDMILFAAPVAALLGVGLSSLLSVGAAAVLGRCGSSGTGAGERAAAIVLALALVLAAMPSSARLDPPITFEEQSEFMHALADGLSDDDTVLVISLPEFMIHTGRPSVWKWPYMWFGVDAFADATTADGFDGLLAQLDREPPGLMIVARRWRGALRVRFDAWAVGRYERTREFQYPHTVRPINVYRLRSRPSDGE